MLAAQQLGKPVKWVGSRFETIVSDHHGRAAHARGRARARPRRPLPRPARALGGERRRLPVAARAAHQYAQSGDATRSTSTASRRSTAATCSRSPTPLPPPPTAARAGPTSPISSSAWSTRRRASSGIDRTRAAAHATSSRRRRFPYKTPVGSTYDSGDPAGEFEEALEKSDWDSFEARRKESMRNGKLRGIGCAVFCEPSGAGALPKEEAVIRFGSTGNAMLHVHGRAFGAGARNGPAGSRGADPWTGS